MSQKKYKTILVVALIFFCCDFYKPTEVEQVRMKTLPVFEMTQVEIPLYMQQSQDSVARLAIELIQFQDTLAEYVQLIALPKDSLFAGPPWNYYWTNPAGVNAALKVDERDTIITEYVNRNFKDVTYQNYNFELRFSGYDSEKSVTYSDWLFIKASMGNGSTDAKITVNEDCSATEYFNFWSSFMFESGGLGHYYRFSKPYKECTYFSINYISGSYSYVTNFDFKNDANKFGFTVTKGSSNRYAVTNAFFMEIDKGGIVYHLVWDNSGSGKWMICGDWEDLQEGVAW